MRLGSEDLSGVNKVKPNSSIAGRIIESDKMREKSLNLVSGMLVMVLQLTSKWCY